MPHATSSCSSEYPDTTPTLPGLDTSTSTGSDSRSLDEPESASKPPMLMFRRVRTNSLLANSGNRTGASAAVPNPKSSSDRATTDDLEVPSASHMKENSTWSPPFPFMSFESGRDESLIGPDPFLRLDDVPDEFDDDHDIGTEDLLQPLDKRPVVSQSNGSTRQSDGSENKASLSCILSHPKIEKSGKSIDSCSGAKPSFPRFSFNAKAFLDVFSVAGQTSVRVKSTPYSSQRFEAVIIPVALHQDLWDINMKYAYSWPAVLVLTDNAPSGRLAQVPQTLVDKLEIECAMVPQAGPHPQSERKELQQSYFTNFRGQRLDEESISRINPSRGICLLYHWDLLPMKVDLTTRTYTRSWQMKFWVPIPTPLLAKVETRMFRIRAGLTFNDDRENAILTDAVDFTVSLLRSEQEMKMHGRP